jgi:hypothetical protein
MKNARLKACAGAAMRKFGSRECPECHHDDYPDLRVYFADESDPAVEDGDPLIAVAMVCSRCRAVWGYE